MIKEDDEVYVKDTDCVYRRYLGWLDKHSSLIPEDSLARWQYGRCLKNESGVWRVMCVKPHPERGDEKTLAFIDNGQESYIVSVDGLEPVQEALCWEDLNVGDVIRKKSSGIEFLVLAKSYEKDTTLHIRCFDGWYSDEFLEEFEKVE